MDAPSLIARFQSVPPELIRSFPQVDVQENEGRVLFRTGERVVARRRLAARVLCVLGGMVGLTLVPMNLWAGALLLLGLAGWFAAPRLIWSRPLVEVDGTHGLLAVRQPEAESGPAVEVGQIDRVAGEYEVVGWDSQSAFYAVLADGTRRRILVLSGTDEPLAEYVCRLLGLLLDRPASYAGPFGGVADCYVPAAGCTS